jgi:hypothetical protein
VSTPNHYLYHLLITALLLLAVSGPAAFAAHFTACDKPGVVVAKTPGTMLTGGDKVTVLVHQADDGRVEVDITSKTSYQLIAWGKNRDNILRLYGLLDQLMSASRDS